MPFSMQTILLNPRLLAMLALGFAAGLPLALTGSTLQAWFTEAHMDITTIGFLTLLGLPYTLKFLWAPLMDHFKLPLLDKRRGWILLMQIALILTMLGLAEMQPLQQAKQMGVMALLLAFFSASQDIAISAYQTDVLSEKERGLGSAYYIFAYRIATLLSGGIALVVASYLGFRLTYNIMAGFMLLSLMLTYFLPRATELNPTSSHLAATIFAALRDLLQREKIMMLLLFLIFYKFGDALALALMTNFLLHGLGFTLIEVGFAYKVMSVVATIIGAFVGGALLTRWSIYRALLWFGLAQAVSNVLFAVLAAVGKQFALMTFTIFIENFCSGLSTAALLAFMMSLCNHQYTASQFALFSAVASLGRVFLGPLASVMVVHLGWVQFYLWSVVLCFPGILFLILLKNEVLYHAPAPAD